ncbi:hypothetical protein GCK32_018806 [Trichostrongylus colubriformis]|uniref:Uncharacterized protein n=1 Tax=Trichostrongylus colubriformis TaxID=6319 RepID=A0AAN8G351_TRICO
MHPLMTSVLAQRQLNAAGQLFTLSDYDVITDLHTAFSRLKEIFNTPRYVERRVDQSVVEIVIARIAAAIRETGCIETYSAELVDVLDSCLRHPMTVLNSEGEYIRLSNVTTFCGIEKSGICSFEVVTKPVCVAKIILNRFFLNLLLLG